MLELSPVFVPEQYDCTQSTEECLTVKIIHHHELLRELLVHWQMK